MQRSPRESDGYPWVEDVEVSLYLFILPVCRGKVYVNSYPFLDEVLCLVSSIL